LKICFFSFIGKTIIHFFIWTPGMFTEESVFSFLHIRKFVKTS